MIRMSLQPDTGEVLAGLVERVAYHNAENGFCVLRASEQPTLSGPGRMLV
jgi:exodeoxyribonuclease V alpha subunit